MPCTYDATMPAPSHGRVLARVVTAALLIAGIVGIACHQQRQAGQRHDRPATATATAARNGSQGDPRAEHGRVDRHDLLSSSKSKEMPHMDPFPTDTGIDAPSPTATEKKPRLLPSSKSAPLTILDSSAADPRQGHPAPPSTAAHASRDVFDPLPHRSVDGYTIPEGYELMSGSKTLAFRLINPLEASATRPLVIHP